MPTGFQLDTVVALIQGTVRFSAYGAFSWKDSRVEVVLLGSEWRGHIGVFELESESFGITERTDGGYR